MLLRCTHLVGSVYILPLSDWLMLSLVLESILRKGAYWPNLGQISTWTNQPQLRVGPHCTCHCWSISCVWRESMWAGKPNSYEMFFFSINGRIHHLSLPNHDYLTSSRYLIFSFHLCLACHYFLWFGKEHRARHNVDRGKFLGQWYRADLFWTFPWCPRDAHLPFHNAGRSGSLGEGKWKGQMMKLKFAFGPGDNALF